MTLSSDKRLYRNANILFNDVIHYMLVFGSRREKRGRVYERAVNRVAVFYPVILDFVNGNTCLFCGREFKDKRSLAIHLVKSYDCRSRFFDMLMDVVRREDELKRVNKYKKEVL